MAANLPRFGAWLLCFLASCTRNDTLGGASSSEAARTNAMQARAPLPRESVRLPVEGQLPSLDTATGWINSPPLNAAGLRGKVVLVQFWTYSCINWRRTMPYVRAWSEKYAAAGLVVLGVHTPEFDFEKDIGNVRKFMADANIRFATAVDSEGSIWSAFGNEYWPALYLVDAEGRIRHHQFGEGRYDTSEVIIQQLLTEAGRSNVASGVVTVASDGAELAADWANLRSGENYLGYERTQGFLSTLTARVGRAQVFPEPPPLRLNQWSVRGEWSLGANAVRLNAAGGRVSYRFHARDLHLVMGATAPGTVVRFRVRLDGHPPGDAHGVDIDAEGNGSVREPRMFQLLRQAPPIADRDFEIEFLDAPVDVFSVTFG